MSVAAAGNIQLRWVTASNGPSRLLDRPGAGYADLLARNAATPGLVKLFVDLAAAEPDHPAHAFFTDRYDRFRTELAAGTHLGPDPARVARVLIAD
ncbi:hypothetical protein [Streptomyces sp. LaBMicrA B280]|uniref:hypothetical protein n=1 Tax=Streptomyces sp. LaBMicrA B280 TaxID=3391001 RepID=UPI003BA716A7